MTKTTIRLITAVVTMALGVLGCSRTAPDEPLVPEINLTISTPAHDGLLDWSDDAEPSTSGFQLAIKGSVQSSSNTLPLSVSLRIDDTDIASPITVEDSAFEFEPVTLEAGFHRLDIKASNSAASDLAQLKVVVPEVIVIPPPDQDIAFSTPENGAIFSLDEDAEPDVPGFQTPVTGKLTAFSSAVILQLSRNGQVLSAQGVLDKNGTDFSFGNITLPEGDNVLIAVASEEVAGETIKRTAVITVNAPKTASDIDIEIASPKDASFLSWNADLDEMLEGYQLNINGVVRGDELESSSLALTIDGVEVPVSAKLTERNSSSETGAQDSHSTYDFSFSNITLEQGVHLISVTATHREATGSAQIYVAIPDKLPLAPVIDIFEPLNGAGIAIEPTAESTSIDVTGSLGNATSATLYINGQVRDAIPVIEDGQFTFSEVELSIGTHTLQVQASDEYYSGMSPTTTVTVLPFAIEIMWPTSGTVIYLDDNDGEAQASTEVIGRLVGCDGCTGRPTISYKIMGEETETAIEIDTNSRLFRKAIQLTTEGRNDILITAKQAKVGTRANGDGTIFFAESSMGLDVKTASERPTASLEITSPTDGVTFGWRDNESLSEDTFTASIKARVDNISIGDATFEVFVDGILRGASETSSNCALTTSGTAITAISCAGIDLGGTGAHLIRLVATLNDAATMVDDYILVTVPELTLPEQPQVAVAITSRTQDEVLTWKDDISLDEGFQVHFAGRFAGFASVTSATLSVDGNPQDSVVWTAGDNAFSFSTISLEPGRRSIAVHLTGTSFTGLTVSATDVIELTVPQVPTLSLIASRDDAVANDATKLEADLTGFSDSATFTLETYADGISVSSENYDLTTLSAGILIADTALHLDESSDCHSAFFVLTGTEGLSHFNAISNTITIGDDCMGHIGVPTILITSPRNGDAIAISQGSSALISVSGKIIGDLSGTDPGITMDSIPCAYDSMAQTFVCTGDFIAGEHDIMVQSVIPASQSQTVRITVHNTTGCPITMINPGVLTDPEGRFIFNRNTPGLVLSNSMATTVGSYTFKGTVPEACSGGTVKIMKRLTENGPFESEAKIVNILNDGSFSYGATLNDGESHAQFVLSASKAHFEPASGATLSYVADFTVPTLVAAQGDTFSLEADAAAVVILHEKDTRDGLKGIIEIADDQVVGRFDISFTVKGLNTDPYALDTMTITYNGADVPLLDETLLPQEMGASNMVSSFTKSIALPAGDWILTLTLTDTNGNTSARSFPVHVDLSCDVALISPRANTVVPLAFDELAQKAATLAIEGTSACAGAIYDLTADGNLSGVCQPSTEEGLFNCAIDLTEDAIVTLSGPDGKDHVVDVRLVSISDAIEITSPILTAGGITVVTHDNIHCDQSGIRECEAGYVQNINDNDNDDMGNFHLTAAIEPEEDIELSCAFSLNGTPLDQNCLISTDGVISQKIKLPNGTKGIFTLRIQKTPVVDASDVENDSSDEIHSIEIATSFGITVATAVPAAPVFLLPGEEGNSVTDCQSDQSVTCIRNRHQGILDIWLTAPAANLTRTRGYVTGTKVSLTAERDNTEAFDANTFTDGTLMTWFSATPKEVGKEFQRINATPMNFVHLAAQDIDRYGNRSPVAIVKSIDMFWHHFQRTFTEENSLSALEIDTTSGFAFGALSAVGDFNGDHIDDVVISGGTFSTPSLIMAYYGAKDVGLSDQTKDVILNDQGSQADGSISANYFLRSLAAVDLDHDGFDDLIGVYYAGAQWNQPIRIWFGTPNGLSQTPREIVIDYSQEMGGGHLALTGYINVLAIDDIDGDGFKDVAFAESTKWQLDLASPFPPSNLFIVQTGEKLRQILRATEQTSIADVATWQINSMAEPADSIGLGLDLGAWNIFTIPDGQNAPILLVGAPGTQKAYLFRTSTLAQDDQCAPPEGCDADAMAFQTIAVPESHTNTNFGSSMAVLDGNNDGLPDIYFGMPDTRSDGDLTKQDNAIFVTKGRTGEQGLEFAELEHFNDPREALQKNYFAKVIREANLLNDGYLALIATTSSTENNRAFIYWNDPITGLSSQYGSIIEGPPAFGNTLETGDFNGDGQTDILFGAPNYTPQKITSDPNGEFHVYY